jgi:hypothetical protein
MQEQRRHWKRNAVNDFSTVLWRWLYCALPIVVCGVDISLMQSYLRYYGIGVNDAANAGFLGYFVAPLLLIGLALLAWLALCVMRRLCKSKLHSMWGASTVVVAAGILMFLSFVYSFNNYPTEQTQDLSVFLLQWMQGDV